MRAGERAGERIDERIGKRIDERIGKRGRPANALRLPTA